MDTITAVATGKMNTAIGIVRVSGPDAFSIVSKTTKTNIYEMSTFSVKFGNIVDGENVVDEVLFKKFVGPNTFTGEDIIEIDCHGGMVVKNKIIELLVKNGARIAEPGEFTRRAYLNGKIDLVKSEAIHDLVFSSSDKARSVAINSLKGSTSKLIDRLRNKLIQVIGNVEVNIDYPEYDDYEELTNTKLLPISIELRDQMKEVLADAKIAKVIKEGVNVAIVGKPNVGKSSLLNALIGEQKAIVTNIKGTTRDVVTESITIDGYQFNLMDTAGIRTTNDAVEQIGIEKSYQSIEGADIILVVLDASEKISAEDKEILNLVRNKNYITVLNKTDLPKVIDIDGVNISAKEEEIKNLIDKIKHKLNIDSFEPSAKGYLSNARQIGLLEKSLAHINDAINGMENSVPVDLVVVDLESAWTILGEILGVEVKENFLNEIFSRFCLGK